MPDPFYAGQLLRASALQAILDDRLIVTKGGDTARLSNNTLQADPHLTLPIKAGYVYAIDIVVYSNSPTTADIQFALSVPSGAFFPFGGLRLVSSASVTGDADPGAYNNATSGTSNIVAAGSGLANTTLLNATVDNPTNDGFVTLMWAQNASVASNTTVYEGSRILAQRER